MPHITTRIDPATINTARTASTVGNAFDDMLKELAVGESSFILPDTEAGETVRGLGLSLRHAGMRTGIPYTTAVGTNSDNERGLMITRVATEAEATPKKIIAPEKRKPRAKKADKATEQAA